jgi:hypothetical protein
MTSPMLKDWRRVSGDYEIDVVIQFRSDLGGVALVEEGRWTIMQWNRGGAQGDG